MTGGHRSVGARTVRGDHATMDMEAAVQGEAMDDTANSNRLRERLERSGATSGEVQISLMWENYNDLDLHVVAPSGGTNPWWGTATRSAEVSSMWMPTSNPNPRSPSRTSYGPRTPPQACIVYVHHYQFHKKRRTKDPTKFEVVVHANGEYTESTRRRCRTAIRSCTSLASRSSDAQERISARVPRSTAF